jgi:hypothetical protein
MKATAVVPICLPNPVKQYLQNRTINVNHANARQQVMKPILNVSLLSFTGHLSGTQNVSACYEFGGYTSAEYECIGLEYTLCVLLAMCLYAKILSMKNIGGSVEILKFFKV